MSDKILVVEDEPLILINVSDHLAGCGFQVIEARDAASAIGEIKAHPDIVLVFTDVRMPGDMDGIGLVRWIFANRPDIAVVIASGNIGRQTAMRELCGARAFSKPYRLDEVTEHIRQTLRARGNENLTN